MRRSLVVRSASLIREARKKPTTQSSISRELIIPRARNGDGKEVQMTRGCGKVDESSWWIPHPRTGIYYPKGHEWVMEGIPEGASSFPKSYWLRSFDGVDKWVPDHDQPCLDV